MTPANTSSPASTYPRKALRIHTCSRAPANPPRALVIPKLNRMCRSTCSRMSQKRSTVPRKCGTETRATASLVPSPHRQQRSENAANAEAGDGRDCARCDRRDGGYDVDVHDKRASYALRGARVARGSINLSSRCTSMQSTSFFRLWFCCLPSASTNRPMLGWPTV